MKTFRVKEVKGISNGSITYYFYPQYKRTFFGIGWWATYDHYSGRAGHSAPTKLADAWNYIDAKNNCKPVYHYK